MLRSRVAFDRRGAWTAGDSHEDLEDVDVFTPHLSSLALRLGTTVILILTQLAVNTKPRILGSSMPTYPRGNLERPGVRATYLPAKPGLDRARRRIFTHLSLAQLAERETVVFTAISRSSVRLREGRPVKNGSKLWG